MTQRNDGGPAFTCGKTGCSDVAVIRQGHQWLCAKHYRFGQMRTRAKRDGKAVPSHEELHRMPGSNLECPDCRTRMNWRAKDGRSTVASLQHYRDGSMAIVCLSCNTRHAFMLGDEYRGMPKDQKLCPKCRQIKPLTDFGTDRGRTGPMKIKSWCKQCASRSHTEWQRSNREHYNAKQRESRHARRDVTA